MPRSLKVVIACDNCKATIEGGEQHDGGMVVTINGGQAKQIDLCPSCMNGDNPLSPTELVHLYNNADGIPQAKPAKRRTKRPVDPLCPLCDHHAATPQALGRHVRRDHHMNLAEALKERRINDESF